MSRHGENIYKRKDGRWEGRYKNGFRENGKPKYSSVYGKSYNEVRLILSKKRIDLHDPVVHRKTTFAEIALIWLENVKKNIKESTYVNYYMKINKHILPTFGSIIYEDLTTQMINNFVASKMLEDLSPKYVSDIVNLIKSISKFARRTYNYTDQAEFVILPKEKKNKEIPVLNKYQQKILIDYLIKNDTLSNIGILLSLLTGIRIGELCALKWSDIDLEERVLNVIRTMQRIKNIDEITSTKILIDSPKSERSARVIPIPDLIIKILEKHKTADEFYFLTGSRNFIEPRTMQYRFTAILRELGLPKIGFHSLRHTFATNCITIGFDVKTLSEILGHSSVEITLNCYVHSSLDRKRRCMELLDHRFLDL